MAYEIQIRKHGGTPPIADIIYETKYKSKENWTGAENTDLCFCVIFDCY